eukprot:10401778-Prorocentrum_lima.AAC.1
MHRSRVEGDAGEWELEPVYRDLEIWLNDKRVWTDGAGFLVPMEDLPGLDAEALRANLAREGGAA